MFYLIYIIVSCVVHVYAKNELYKGYQIYKIHFQNEEQQSKLHSIKSDMIDFIRKPSYKYNVSGLALVPPSHINWLEEKLEEIGVNKDVYMEDVYEYLSQSEASQSWRDSNSIFSFDAYHRYETIRNHMRNIAERYQNSPEIEVNYTTGAVTDEGRPIDYLKLTKYSVTPKPVVIIEAGVNPREWITVPAALHIIDKVLTNEKYLENFLWIVIPVVNPDGYEYTHTNLRFWSKSRSVRSNLGFICPGVHINRNFDIDWLISDSSSSPCSHLYAGVEPFSEPESKFIRSLHEEYGRRIQLYISLQNSGGFISYPWQYERAASGMFPQHYLLGANMVDAMDGDYQFDVGSLVYGDRASGTSTDYLSINEVMYPITIDIAAVGRDGVEIPSNEIEYNVENVWKAVSVAADSFI